MKKWLKRLVLLLLVLAVAGGGLVGYAYWNTGENLARNYVVDDPPLTLSNDPATIAQGAHIFATRGCSDCHGADGAGKLVFDAGPVMKLVAPNITPGGVVKGASADQIAAAIRHGVKPDHHPMLFMPSGDFKNMSDADTAALVAYIQSLAPSSNDPGPSVVKPLGHVLYLFGKFPLLPAEKIDHAPRSRTAPKMAATAEYGKYLAQGCTGCHGHDFAGQHVPGTPPDFPDAQNLTPGNIGQWSNEDFRRALREGKRPDGSALKDFMPWRTFAKMSDTEIDALYAFLHALPPVANKKK